jgi:hypothetical protein
VLVGTHASTVPDANVVVDALFNEMNAKYPSFIKAKLAVDSIDGTNIKQLKKEIIFLAQSQVLSSSSFLFNSGNFFLTLLLSLYVVAESIFSVADIGRV